MSCDFWNLLSSFLCELHFLFFFVFAVHIKLADYSISRFSNPGGLRGVEGTAGYQAPEIIQHWDQAFDEKVRLVISVDPA